MVIINKRGGVDILLNFPKSIPTFPKSPTQKIGRLPKNQPTPFPNPIQKNRPTPKKPNSKNRTKNQNQKIKRLSQKQTKIKV